MKITAQDLERQYRQMADGELLSLNPGELSDVARTCLEKEIARRGLSEPEDAHADVPPEDGALLASYVTRGAAENALSWLTAAGIPATLDGNALYVAESLHRDAHHVLEGMESQGPELAEQWLRDTLPGCRILIEDLLSQDDLVAARLTIDGRHQAFCFLRINGREIAESWHNFDQLPQ